MKLIEKQKEPNSLKNHRLKANIVDDGKRVKTTYESFCREIGLGDIQPATGFRKYILEDQGYLCAYCMRRIPHRHEEKGIERDDMKIEHWLSQRNSISIAKRLDITYNNMFGCCMGGKGNREKFETCDTRKAEDDITINPTNKVHIATLKYGLDGLIVSTDATFDGEINSFLNLNEFNLKNRRAAIYESVKRKTEEKFKTLMDRKAKNEYLNKEIEWWLKPTNKRFREYCMVAVVYLQSRLR